MPINLVADFALPPPNAKDLSVAAAATVAVAEFRTYDKMIIIVVVVVVHNGIEFQQ